MSQKVAHIEGTTCGHCENAVTESLTSLGNLTQIEVSSTDGTARFVGDIDQAALAAAIDDAGYKLISVSDE
jgi:copper chaperone